MTRECTDPVCASGTCDDMSYSDTMSCDPGLAPKVCGNNSVCTSGECHEDDCMNGADDDGDNMVDCADPSCNGKVCDAGGGTCVGGICFM